MDRGAWWASVHGVTKGLDTTQQLNNKDSGGDWERAPGCPWASTLLPTHVSWFSCETSVTGCWQTNTVRSYPTMSFPSLRPLQDPSVPLSHTCMGEILLYGATLILGNCCVFRYQTHLLCRACSPQESPRPCHTALRLPISWWRALALHLPTSTPGSTPGQKPVSSLLSYLQT